MAARPNQLKQDQDFQILVKPGEKLAVDSSLSRAGYALTIGENQEQAIERAEEVLDKIEIS